MLRRALTSLIAAALLAACAADPLASTTVTTVVPANTVGGVGRLPSTIPAVTFPEDVAEGFVLPALEGVAVGDEVTGNRVLMIGDSIFAGLSRRYSNTACDQLVPLGWQVAVEAESGRFAEFGERVARRRAGEGWDVVVVFLGSNYDGARQRYEQSMREILDRFDTVPVVLVTTSLFRTMQSEVNTIVRDLASERADRRVIEWEEISRTRGLLSGDRLHPSADGQVVLTAAVAQVLGAAPGGEGRCLPSLYTDDSLNPQAPQSGGRANSTNSASATTSANATTVPEESSTETSEPDDSAPDDSAPDDSAPDDSAPDDSAPDDSAPDDSVTTTSVVPDTTPTTDTTTVAPSSATTVAPSPDTTSAP